MPGLTAALPLPFLAGPAGSRSSARPDLSARARAAAMVEDYYPVQWTGRQVVVVLPQHIGISNAGQVRGELLSVINRGAQGLITDMTATISCDHAGADADHTAHAGMRQVKGGGASSARALTDDAPENARRSARSNLDVTDRQTIGVAVQALLTAEGRLYEHSVHITRVRKERP